MPIEVVSLVEINPEELECECEKNMTEQKYLELADSMKGVIEEKDRQVKRAEDKAKAYKNSLCKVYGVLRMIIDVIGACDFGSYTDTIQNSFDYLIECMKESLDLE